MCKLLLVLLNDLLVMVEVFIVVQYVLLNYQMRIQASNFPHR